MPPLEQDLGDQRVDVDEDDDIALQMPEATDQRVPRAAVGLDVLLRDALHVHHLVHRHADHARAVRGEMIDPSRTGGRAGSRRVPRSSTVTIVPRRLINPWTNGGAPGNRVARR